jgi:hypothetical protein
LLVPGTGYSVAEVEWRDEMTHSDLFTNFRSIISVLPKIARTGKIQLVQDALHDVFLSSMEVRTTAYKYVWEFIGEVLNESS